MDRCSSFLVTRAAQALAVTLLFGSACAQTSPLALQHPVPELKFRDFFRSPVGPIGLEPQDALLQAQGKTVRLVGFMVQQEVLTPGRFMLTPRPVQMSEHADGEADDLPATTVVVYLSPEHSHWTVPHVRGLVELSGVLQLGRLEERDGRVSWVRLQLTPDAARGMNAFELAGHLHALQHHH